MQLKRLQQAVEQRLQLLGLLSLSRDLGWKLTRMIGTDSSAAKGMASRQAAGTVRHMHTPALWLQQTLTRRELKIEKRSGTTFSPDIGTKTGIAAPAMWDLLTRVGVVRS